jgi:hypothetical protein
MFYGNPQYRFNNWNMEGSKKLYSINCDYYNRFVENSVFAPEMK